MKESDLQEHPTARDPKYNTLGCTNMSFFSYDLGTLNALLQCQGENTPLDRLISVGLLELAGGVRGALLRRKLVA